MARRITTGFRPTLSEHCPQELKYWVDSMLHIRAENRPVFSELSEEVHFMCCEHTEKQKLRGAFDVLCRTTSIGFPPEVNGSSEVHSTHRAGGS